MLDAAEAYEKTLENLNDTETIDLLIQCDNLIKEAIEKKGFAACSPPVLAPIAEKLGIELEEYGYATSVQFSNRFNEQGQPLCFVHICWRFLPPLNSRIVNSEAIKKNKIPLKIHNTANKSGETL